ncbi:MAG: heterodisulfide reductase-related iron-sulfur binding cluster, partial [Acidobacteria bacterium]|nr:heterodisulfide reductase-related iron-sulfur binding cluster [Acidobacteriota bacterium]
VQVDMATYKAEFLSHYYEGKLRPMAAYTMGRIHRWARLAALLPGAANFLTHAPGFHRMAKLAAGIHPERTIPAFAPYTFQSWFPKRGAQFAAPGQPPVILWPDTFNNYFHVQTAEAAAEVLHAAGFDVQVPRRNFCCGRPLFDWGLVDEAKGLLANILEGLKQPIEDGTPVVVLEPSCASVFRDELVNLFPNNENAARLRSQTFLLSEFLERKAPRYQPPKLHRRAIVHGHCHHKSLFKMDDEENLLKKMELEYNMPDSGCCGMAGAFGFERDHYHISVAMGGRVLLPGVLYTPKHDLVVTDGFSCREQISQTTGRHALHLAQVIQMAMHDGMSGPAGDYPEKNYVARPVQYSKRAAAGVGAAALLLGAGLWWGWRKVRSRR